MVLIVLRGVIIDAMCVGGPVLHVLRAVTTEFAAATGVGPDSTAQMPIGPLR